MAVSCSKNSSRLLSEAKRIADSLDLPCLEESTDVSHHPFILYLTEKGLELRVLIDKTSRYNTCYVDFTHGASGYRLQHNLTTRQPLARAVGIVPGFRPDIFDVTAGLGSDGFVLASLGCKVTMIERSPIIGALLQDGLKRAEKSAKSQAIVKNHISLIIDDATNLMRTIDQKPHTIYMDPMYPHKNKKALNKIEMRIIRQLVGDDTDSPALLQQALKTATNRVVVKRPKGAPTIDRTSPTHTIKMKNSRFDVYMTKTTDSEKIKA